MPFNYSLMRLFIAEKRVLGEAIAAALEGKEEMRDSVLYKGNNAIVWTFGHLLTLREPESYDKKYKSWNIGDLPIYFEGWQNAVPKENAARVKKIGELIKQADEVVNCGDTDEEGQLLVDELLRWFKYKGPCKRLDTANTTVDALKKNLARMKDNRECEAAGWSAYAREVADITFGINFTRFFSKIYSDKLPVGRVMTPTLGLVVNRDRAIEGHKKSYYYNLTAESTINGVNVLFRFVPDKELEELEDGKFMSDDYLKDLSTGLSGKKGIFTVKKQEVKETAPLPFNLTTLTNFCGKKWGYNPDDVMRITQSLRDDHSAITYNRSDCQYLSMEHHREAPRTVSSICNNLGVSSSPFDTKRVSRCFNDDNITAHFAIIPTDQPVDVSRLSDEQRNVYKAIAVYYLIQFLPSCIKEKTTVFMNVSFKGNDVGKLEAVSLKVLMPGFAALLRGTSEKEEEEEDNESQESVTSIPAGQYDGVISKTEIIKKETKPPKRYTQSSLFVDMTRISRFVDDPEVKKLLLEKDKEKKGENGSIGTSATRAEIIKKLISGGFLEEREEKKKTSLISTDKGRRFYDLLPDSIKKADTTAKWWVIQEEIKNGESDYKALTDGVVSLIKEIISEYKPDESMVKQSDFKSEKLCICPVCGSDIVTGQYGPYCKGKCGFKKQRIYGADISDVQFAALIKGEKVEISGFKDKTMEGVYSAVFIADGYEDFKNEYKGKTYSGKRLKVKKVD